MNRNKEELFKCAVKTLIETVPQRKKCIDLTEEQIEKLWFSIRFASLFNRWKKKKSSTPTNIKNGDG